MNKTVLNKIIRAALQEDIGSGDITTNLSVGATHRSQAVIIVKEQAVLCGLTAAEQVFRSLDPGIKFRSVFSDGDTISAGDQIISLSGRTRAILTGERVALNFLSYLSAIATKTRRFCELVRPSVTDILDTRKTTPTLRVLERYAVRSGGGVNHRFNLSSMVLVKDNHRVLMSAGSLAETIRAIRKKTHKKIEVEVDTLKELRAVLPAEPDMILLDNMSLGVLRQAVQMTHKMFPGKRPLLEASGGINLKNVRAVARTGVDRISVGDLTHSRKAVDFSLELKG